MTYFAVNMKHGFDGFKLKKMIDRLFPEDIKSIIKGIIEPVAFVQKKTANRVKKTTKNMSYGYVYLDVETNADTIPVELYHELNQLPWLTQIFSNDVPKAEVEAFCHNVGLRLEESEIVFEVAATHQDTIEALVEVINDANTNIEEQQEAAQQLEEELSNPTCLVEKAKLVKNQHTKGILVIVKEKRGRMVGKIRISLGLIVKAIKETEQRTGLKISNEEIQSETFLLDLLYQHCQHKK